MADKGKRIASRQAQLKRRKRRGKGRPQQFDAGPTEPRSPAPAEGEAAPAAASAPQAGGRTQAGPRPGPRARKGHCDSARPAARAPGGEARGGRDLPVPGH